MIHPDHMDLGFSVSARIDATAGDAIEGGDEDPNRSIAFVGPYSRRGEHHSTLRNRYRLSNFAARVTCAPHAAEIGKIEESQLPILPPL